LATIIAAALGGLYFSLLPRTWRAGPDVRYPVRRDWRVGLRTRPRKVAFSESGKQLKRGEVWFIAYHHALRPDEAGVKIVQGREAAVTEGQRLEAVGYIITKIAPARIRLVEPN
jgi:hypothetical protein